MVRCPSFMSIHPIFLFFLLGLAAVILSVLSSSAADDGDMESARLKGKISLGCSLTGIAITVISIIIVIVVLVVMVDDAVDDVIEASNNAGWVIRSLATSAGSCTLSHKIFTQFQCFVTLTFIMDSRHVCPVDTWRNDNGIIASKWRRDVVLTWVRCQYAICPIGIYPYSIGFTSPVVSVPMLLK